MSENSPHLTAVLSQVASTLEHFPTLEDLNQSELVLRLKQTLTQQYWKQHSLKIDQELYDGKSLVGDSRFGDDETDADVIPIFLNKGLQKTVEEILAEYDITLLPDEWQTLLAWAHGSLEAQRTFDWLEYSYQILERQYQNLKSVVGESETKQIYFKLLALKEEIEHYKGELENNPETVISRSVEKATTRVAEIKNQLSELLKHHQSA